MKLNRTALTQSAALTDYVLPQYDVARVTEKTAALFRIKNTPNACAFGVFFWLPLLDSNQRPTD